MLGVEMEREGKHGVKCEEIKGRVSGQGSGEMGLGLRRFWRPSRLSLSKPVGQMGM